MCLTQFLPCEPSDTPKEGSRPAEGPRAALVMPPWPQHGTGRGRGAVLGGHQLLPTALAGHEARVRGGTDAPTHHPPPPVASSQLLPSLAAAPPKLATPQLPGNTGMNHLGDFFLLLTEGSKALQRVAAG